MTFQRFRRVIGAAIALTVLAPLAACGSSDTTASANTVNYWLWDSAQQPVYQKCADVFAKENPGKTIKISQFGWGDYWQKLTASFITGTSPDVFTDHLAKYPQFVDLKVLQPLDKLEATRNIKDSDYQPGLAALWRGQDGLRYGVPKDFDTVAFFYDKQELGAAGITPDQLKTARWNPQDGGSFEKILAHLTIDKNGKRGDEPGFDKTKVATYGMANAGGGGDNYGQTQWGIFAASMNDSFHIANKNPWGTKLNFDDPNFQQMLTWYFDLIKKGYMPAYSVTSAMGTDQQLGTGLAVLAPNGSWMINTFKRMQLKNKSGSTRPIDLGIAPSPIGPVGHNASPFNGLADSITRTSKDPQLAAKWVAFMGSATCQNIVGRSGAVFPARIDSLQLAIDTQKANKVDVSAFTDHLKNHTTELLPVTVNSGDVNAVLRPAFDGYMIGSSPISDLTNLNGEIDKVLKQR